MINQMNQSDHTPNAFSDAFKQLQIGKLMRKSNIKKSCGISAYEVFQFLLLLAFQRKNLFRFLNSKHNEQAVSKNTYYRILNETSYNWSRFLLLLAVKVTAVFDSLTRPERVKVLILDDSVIKRNHSKSVEKIVFVRNRNKKSECFFKSSKSFLKLGTEFQSHNYGAMVRHLQLRKKL